MSEDREEERKTVTLPDGRLVGVTEAREVLRAMGRLTEVGDTFRRGAWPNPQPEQSPEPVGPFGPLTKERKAQIEREHRERTRKRREPGSASVTRYRAYLESAAWQAKRLAALKRAGFVCLQCGSRDRLEVHHLSYERLGDELPADLTVLCARCHGFKHL